MTRRLAFSDLTEDTELGSILGAVRTLSRTLARADRVEAVEARLREIDHELWSLIDYVVGDTEWEDVHTSTRS